MAFVASKSLMNHVDLQTSGTLRSVHSPGSSFSQIACELLKKTEVKEAIDADYEPWAINIIEGIPIGRITPEKIKTFRSDSKMQLIANGVMNEGIEMILPSRHKSRHKGLGWGRGWTGSWSMSRLIKSSPDMGKHSGTEKRWGSG